MSRNEDRTGLISLRVAALYLLAAAIWIPLSDAVVNRVASNREELNRLQTFKGWLFIVLTATLIYWLIQKARGAGQANISEKQSLLTDLQRAARERERLVKHLVKAEKDERERIASGIHDDSIQVMTSAGMALDLLLTRLQPGEERELAERARGYVGDAVKRLRTLVFELKPVELDQEGLAAGHRHVLEKASAEAGFSYEIDDRIFQGLSTDSRWSMYRIAQEAIHNAKKHASASMVRVLLSEENRGIRAKVVDDGAGFDPNRPRPGQHFGLREMEQRAELSGGWCRVSSTPGKGTTVDIWTPLVEPEEPQVVDE